MLKTGKRLYFACFIVYFFQNVKGIVLTYDILLIVVLGGIGSITGSIVGAFFVTAGKELLRFFDEPLIVSGVEVPLFRPGFRMVIYSIP